MRATALIAILAVSLAGPALADETCQSPYLPKVTGQEDFIYVWTVGIEGLGDGSDKLVTVGANPARPGYGQVTLERVGGRPPRGTSRRIHGRPTAALARRNRLESHLHLRRRE